MKSNHQTIMLTMLTMLTTTTQAWADVAPGCDTQPQGASPLMLGVMLSVLGLAVFLGRHSSKQRADV